MSQEPAYTTKGALLFLGVCLFLLGIGGTVLYVSGEETLTCTRDGERRPVCQLARRIIGVEVRDRDLGVVIDAVIVEAGGDTATAGGAPHIGPISYYVEYLAAEDIFSGKASQDRQTHEELRRALVSFVSDPAQVTLRRTVPAAGSSSWFGWVPFGIGASMAFLWVLGFVFPSLRSRPEP